LTNKYITRKLRRQVDLQQLRVIVAILTQEIIRREDVFQYDYADNYPAMVSALVITVTGWSIVRP